MTKEQKEKIGHSSILLATNIPNLDISKLLNLIYLLDEVSVKERGIPFFGLSYQIWQSGPVNQELYIDLHNGAKFFSAYFMVRQTLNSPRIIALSKFKDDEFSDSDIDILERLSKKFKYISAKDLAVIAKRPCSLWYRKAKETGVLDLLNQGIANCSEIDLNLSDLLLDQEEKNIKYKEHKKFQMVIEALSKAH